MSRYDRAITVFSPDGHLLQVEYAIEAVKRAAICVGVRAKDCVVIGVERRSTAKLQDPRTLKKIRQVDDHITLAFSGLNADGRVLVNMARVECQNYRLTYEDAPTVEYLARYLAKTQQRYTQRGGVRPFGVSCLVAGVNADGTPALYQTDPSGTFSAWKGVAIGGKSSTSMQEVLEKKWTEGLEEDEAIKLVGSTLLEVIDAKPEGLDIAVLSQGQNVKMLSMNELTELVKVIEAEAEEAKQSSTSAISSA